MAITAPFRFARINRNVYFPDWGDLVSHDVPFEDGYSGEIEFTITTKTPLLVGGDRKKPTKDVAGNYAAGEVWPFVGPDGRYAIPGSSIQGMIRSILEIATFSKLGPNVKDQRFGVRDLTRRSVTAKKLYKDRMSAGDGGTEATAIRSHAKTGWLIKTSEGAKVLPCSFARIAYDDVHVLTGADVDLLNRTGQYEHVELSADQMRLPYLQRNQIINVRKKELEKNSKDAPARYEAIIQESDINTKLSVNVLIQNKIAEPNHTPGYIEYQRCHPVTEGGVSGTLVITGKPVAGDGTRKKHLEFVFHTPNRQAAAVCQQECEEISRDVLRDFFLIHDPDTGHNAKPNPNWAFWKPHFEKGEPVPIFFLKEPRDGVEQITAIGTAQMFKLAMSLSTHELLAHSEPNHIEVFDRKADSKTGKLDFPSLIFGAIGGEQGADFRHSLKRRVAFDMAKVPENVTVAVNGNNPAVALLSPKPNYYPIYVKQSPQHNQDTPYAAYEDMGDSSQETKRPRLSGVKIWPVSGQNRLNAAARMQDQANVPSAVRTKLNTIPSETTFNGTVRIHNLREVELGALLWAMTFGQESAFGVDGEVLRHRIGGGKPYGLGEIEIRIAKMNTVFRNDKEPALDGATLITNFESYMEKFIGSGWEVSEQITALLKAADVNNNADHAQLQYMNGYADYAAQRATSQTFGDYVTATRELVAQIDASQIAVGMHVKSGPQQGVVLSIAAHGRTVKVALDGSRRHAEFGITGLQIIS